MDKENYNITIFKLLKSKKYDDFFDLIKTNNNINFDIVDDNYNYILNYLVRDNMIDIIKYILDNFELRLDVVDSDGKNILFEPIKYDNIELLKVLLEYNKKIIGLDIINMHDNNGNTPLSYSCILNNMNAFVILYKNNANIDTIDNNSSNIYEILFKYNRTKMILYLLKEEYSKNNHLDTFTKNNESILHLALTYENNEVMAFLMNLNLSKSFLNIQENEYGITALMQSIIINNNNVVMKLLEKGVNYNTSDFIGNTALHYCLYEKNFDILQKLITYDNIEYNYSNSTGDIPLHLCFYNMNITNMNEKYNYEEIFIKILKNSNCNHMNNVGLTPVHLLVEFEWWKNSNVINVLESGQVMLNIFIKNKNNMTPLDMIESSTDKENFINMVVNSYYNYLLKMNKENIVEKWEKYCATNDIDNLLKEINKRPGKEIKHYCKEMIRKMIDENKRSIPKIDNMEFTLDSGIYMKNCFYTGSTIDILFGLVYLHNLNKNIGFILEYPLTQNNNLLEYYKKLGTYYSYKLEFTNIEILWIYQKIIFPTNFDFILKSKLNNDYIIIPLGIDINNNSHANIILIDNTKKTIERFEPNGAKYPRGLNYNDDLLDDILINKFKYLISDYNYFRPKDYLPNVGFQLLESSENIKCKKISDPNGFCAVWCTWWIEMRLMNKLVKRDKLALELINIIKLRNINFKDMIRNYSQKITTLRDEILEKNNITIDDWIIKNYDEEILNNIENDVINILV